MMRWRRLLVPDPILLLVAFLAFPVLLAVIHLVGTALARVATRLRARRTLERDLLPPGQVDVIYARAEDVALHRYVLGVRPHRTLSRMESLVWLVAALVALLLLSISEIATGGASGQTWRTTASVAGWALIGALSLGLTWSAAGFSTTWRYLALATGWHLAGLKAEEMQAAYERAHPEGRDPDRRKAVVAQQWLFPSSMSARPPERGVLDSPAPN